MTLRIAMGKKSRRKEDGASNLSQERSFVALFQAAQRSKRFNHGPPQLRELMEKAVPLPSCFNSRSLSRCRARIMNAKGVCLLPQSEK